MITFGFVAVRTPAVAGATGGFVGGVSNAGLRGACALAGASLFWAWSAKTIANEATATAPAMPRPRPSGKRDGRGGGAKRCPDESDNVTVAIDRA